MTDLTIVPHGTVLIRNGVIEDVGPARRVENLAGAKKAREIDATGRVVMPAFVDADMALVVAAPDTDQALRVTSRQRIQARAAVVASEWARYGCLSVGARTPWATDIKNIGKVLHDDRTQLTTLPINPTNTVSDRSRNYANHSRTVSRRSQP